MSHFLKIMEEQKIQHDQCDQVQVEMTEMQKKVDGIQRQIEKLKKEISAIEKNLKSHEDQKMRIELFDAFLACSEKDQDLNKKI